MSEAPLYRGTSLIIHHPPPSEPTAGLAQGPIVDPGGGRFLMSEVPLHWHVGLYKCYQDRGLQAHDKANVAEVMAPKELQVEGYYAHKKTHPPRILS